MRSVTPDAQHEIESEVMSYVPQPEDQDDYEDAVLRVYSELTNTPALQRESSQFSSRAANCYERMRSAHPTGPFQSPDVALVIPEFLSGRSFLQPPLDMLYAGAFLRQDEFAVALLDNRVEKLSLDAMAHQLASASVVVVTTSPYDQVQNYFVDYRYTYAVKTIRHLKHSNPSRPVIVCGSHGTVRPDLVLRDTGADVVLRGEYESLLPEVVRRLQERRDLLSLPNVAVSNGSDSDTLHRLAVGFAPSGPGPLGLRPAYDLINFQNYFGDAFVNNQPQRLWGWGAVLASRGCRYNCSFCYNFWGNAVRVRDVGEIADEIEWLQIDHGMRRFFFIDFTLTQDRDWALRLCREMRRRDLSARWTAQTRCDLLSEDLLSEMAASGCERLWLGIESFSDTVISSSRKYRSSTSALAAIAMCKKAGIEPHAFLMIGLPGETVDTLNQTLSQVHASKLPYTRSIMVATPRFGTAYYDLAKAQYPELGNDFRSLHSVRGLVANDLKPLYIQEAIDVMRRREFIFAAEAPRITQ
jgi:radical SAM superfamily enzyme YgiQ (UPF0313 family)